MTVSYAGLGFISISLFFDLSGDIGSKIEKLEDDMKLVVALCVSESSVILQRHLTSLNQCFFPQDLKHQESQTKRYRVKEGTEKGCIKLF